MWRDFAETVPVTAQSPSGRAAGGLEVRVSVTGLGFRV